MLHHFPLIIGGALLLAACNSNRYDSEEGGDCQPNEMEPDFVVADEWGPLAEPPWEAPAAGALVSSTVLYLQDDEQVQTRFVELMDELVADLEQREGLMHYSFGKSSICNSYRTIAVWSSQEAMMGFVVAAPHQTAMSELPDIQRRGGGVVSWASTGEAIEWATSIPRLGGDD